MSLKTWRKEFYPIPANRVKEADAIAHSLRKWLGLRKSVLKRHKLVSNGDLFDDSNGGEEFVIDATTCALCCRYFSKTEEDGSSTQEERCSRCPLAKSREGVPCIYAHDSEEAAPYHAWTGWDNPQPMIQALRRAQRWYDLQSKGQRITKKKLAA